MSPFKTTRLIFVTISVLASLPASANYAINGQCFADAGSALDSFNANYPRIDTSSGSPVTWSVSSSSISGQSLTFVLRQGSTDQPSSTTIVQDCTAPTIAPFDIVQALAAFSFFFSGVILIWLVSHGGGIVLSAIKRGGISRSH